MIFVGYKLTSRLEVIIFVLPDCCQTLMTSSVSLQLMNICLYSENLLQEAATGDACWLHGGYKKLRNQGGQRPE